MKRCINCKIDKHLSNFANNKRSKDGKFGLCRLCSALKSKNWRNLNPVKYQESLRLFKLKRRKLDKYIDQNIYLGICKNTRNIIYEGTKKELKKQQINTANINRITRYNKSHYIHRNCFWILKQDYNEQIFQKLKEKSDSQYSERRKQKVFWLIKKCKKCHVDKHHTEYYRHSSPYKCIQCILKTIKLREQIDPIFKIKKLLRSRVHKILKNKQFTKSSSFKKYTGCSPLFLKEYLESKFQPGMTWDNLTNNGWHIDHIIPLASAKSEEEVHKLFHYTNLQPLWAKENIKKGCRF